MVYENASDGYNGSRMYDRSKNYPEIMMKRLLTIVLVCACFASCSNGTDPGSVTDLRVRAFKRGETKFTADTDRAVTDRPVTLTLRCVPLVSGKGLMAICEVGTNENFKIVVESPVRDTLHGDNNYIFVDFVANEPIERSWDVRFPVSPWSGTFALCALVTLDSVYIPEFDRWYSVHSDTAKSHTPSGWGYNNGDKDDDLLFPTP
jgi:hypothetical protein